jgi:hypothetical protein
MQKETQREAILRVLAQRGDWVTRLELIQATGHPKGYAKIIGNALGTAPAQSLVGQGWVEVAKDGNRVRYRLTTRGKNGVRLRTGRSSVDPDLLKAQKQVPAYDPATPADGKRRVLREIAARQGAYAFRNRLLAAFARTCCISGCMIEEILEAAHIRQYDGPNTNDVTNGLLLRADLHTLFDLGLLRIASDTMTVAMHPKLRGAPEYVQYHWKKLIPSTPEPSSKALDDDWRRHGQQQLPRWQDVTSN